MLAYVVRADLEHFLFEVFHVLHGTFIEYIHTEVILHMNFFCLLIDFMVVNPSKETHSFIADVVSTPNPLHLNIERLEFHGFTEGCVEPWHYGACRIDLIAEFPSVLVLLHVVETHARLLGLFFIHTTEDFFLLVSDISILHNALLAIAGR